MDAESKDYLVERAFVALVVGMIENGQLAPRIRNHREFATHAFPLKGERLWKAIRIGSSTTGKPQEVSIEIALAMAKAVGKPLLSLLARAEYMVEDEGWDLDQDPINNRNPRGGAKKVQDVCDPPQKDLAVSPETTA